MLTKPVFINCYSRGGSNILWNVLLSHPDVCSPLRETLDIFHLGVRPLRPAAWAFAVASGQPRFFAQWSFHERGRLSALAARVLDLTLDRWKLRTLNDPEMRFAAPGRSYSTQEVLRSRLAAKNNNGLCFLTPRLREVYPDASFVGLSREPAALYESHKRRHISGDVPEFSRRYNAIAQAMARDAAAGALLLRFEDLIARPVEAIQRIYSFLELDSRSMTKMRFKAKPHLRPDGTRGVDFTPGSHQWFAIEQLDAYFEPAISVLQASQLEAWEREAVLRGTAVGRSLLGYP